MAEIEKRSFKPAEMMSPVPAVMVSCGDMEHSNIITIAWTGIVNSNPPYTYVSVRKSRYSHDMIAGSGEFVINLTTENLARAVDYCGVKSGRDVDKFAETGLTKMACEKVACPMIAESPINLECKVFEIKEYPTHDMFLAEIVAVHVNEDLISDDGKIDYMKAGLITYVHGEYVPLRKTSVGFFGYSVAKKKALKKRSKEEHDRRVKNNAAERKQKKESGTFGKNLPQKTKR